MRAFRWIRVTGLVGLCVMLQSASAAETEWQSSAFLGEPFGVGHIEAQLKDNFPADRSFVFDEHNKRVFYPVVVRSLQDEGSSVAKLRVYFLFRGEEPLHLELATTPPTQLTVKPNDDATNHRDLLKTWWKHFPKQFLRKQQWHREPEALGTYLTGMLARRLDLDEAYGRRQSSWSRRTGIFGNEWSHFAELVIGTRSVKAALQRDTLLKRTDDVEIANQPLPESAELPAVEIPEDFAGRDVEELAYHVPEECFYIRCAGVAEYGWLHNAFATLKMFSQGVQGVTADYTVDPGIHAKLEKQLALRQSTAENLLTPQTLKQLAVIGTDFFVREGAAIGVVFDAHDSKGVADWIKQEQSHALEQEPQAKLQTVQIGKTKGTFLATSDHRVRSFHVSVGRFHLVTNSRKIAERFVEISKANGSLGALREYQYTRAVKFPDDRIGPVFVYLSDAFFRNFIGPQYRIEMTRRAKAASDLELVTFAQFVAKSEGVSADSVGDLVSAELLPASILSRPDHSQPTLKNGRPTDSNRGGRGTFLPIPDVGIQGVTKSEVESYKRFTTFYRRIWTRVDPVALAINEAPSDKRGTIRLVFDLYVTPFVAGQYGMLAAFLPKPDDVHVPPPTGSILFLDIVSPLFGRLDEESRKDLHLFAGVLDFEVPFTIKNAKVKYPKVDEERLPGFLGQTKKSGLVQLFVSDRDRDKIKRDADGYGQFRKNWIRVWNDDWLAIAPQKAVLEQVTPHLNVQPAARSAQLRLSLGDVSQAKIRAAAEAEAYVQTRRMSADTAMYLHRLMQQLHLEPAEVPEAAKTIHEGHLLDPLGGQLQWVTATEDSPGAGWVSTHWPHRSRFADTAVPPGFSHPFFESLSGGLIELSLNRSERSLSSHVEIVVPTSAKLSEQETRER
ncbi:hypothetical protein [Thalassoroseus pseudoceratinae]|uniref:hypothetical protein n=1 Tax=Thalassoroseus pseudoceratinae TaxID=2713176 RepID=UPI001420C132|nr:hypothetical protein [Thalassoroseus pseudoceratinae]